MSVIEIAKDPHAEEGGKLFFFFNIMTKLKLK